MTIIFKAVFNSDAFIFKNFNELLNSNLKNVCFIITQSCIYINQTDDKTTKLFSAEIDTSKLDEFELNSDDPLNIGFNINHLYKTLKILKKKDILELSIDSANIKELIITVREADNTNKVTESNIQIQDMQIIEPELPIGYSNIFSIKASDFQKFIKSTRDVSSKLIRVRSNAKRLDFQYDMSNIIKRKTTFGDNSNTDDTTYTDEFEMKDFIKLIKLSSISSYVNIYTQLNMPIRFESDIGSVGKLNIYIKSKTVSDYESSQ